MRRRYLSIVMGAAMLAALFAPAAPTRAAQSGVPGHDLLLLRAGAGTRSMLVALPAGSARHAVQLPLGLLNGHQQTLYAASPQPDGAHTLVQAIDVASGRVLRSTLLNGRYSTQDGDYSASALSFNGRWLALRSAAANPGHTSAVVIDTAAMRVATTISLSGRFGLDAVDPKGNVLYLIENLERHGPEAYRVRSFELRSGVLDPGAVFEKENTTGTMSGVAWTRAWSPDGDWLFTLYVRPGRQGAFIHALGVEYKIAQCIDLPTDGATAAVLAHFTLTVSGDGNTLYAVNPLLGEAMVMRGSLPYGSTDHNVLSVRATSPERTLDGAALSRDGQSLFVATNHGVWVADTIALTVSATYLAGHNVASLALSPDGRRLYALEPDRGVITGLDPVGGHVLGTIATSAGSWAIATVSSRQ